jgi:hypothetical protein
MIAELPKSPIDLSRLNALFRVELEEFRRCYEISPVPVEQELRASTIAWIAAYVPEALDREARNRLFLTCMAMRDWPDYRDHGWYRASYLEVAMYAITGDRLWLATPIANLDHHSSRLRCSLHAPLGLVAQNISLNFYDLRQRIWNNLAHNFGYCESLLCLYCCFSDNVQDKINQLTVWKTDLGKSQSVEFIDKLLSKYFIKNTVISDEFSEMYAYIVFRLIDGKADERRSDGPDEMPQSSGDDMTVNALWKRVRANRLHSSLVSLRA